MPRSCARTAAGSPYRSLWRRHMEFCKRVQRGVGAEEAVQNRAEKINTGSGEPILIQFNIQPFTAHKYRPVVRIDARKVEVGSSAYEYPPHSRWRRLRLTDSAVAGAISETQILHRSASGDSKKAERQGATAPETMRAGAPDWLGAGHKPHGDFRLLQPENPMFRCLWSFAQEGARSYIAV